MPGTRTAPTVGGTPSYYLVSFTFLDESGDTRSVTMRAPATVTDAQIETTAAALQAASNASIWKVSKSAEYEGALSASNALEDAYPSVYDNISIGFRNTSNGAQQTGYIPAPLTDIVDADSPVVSDALFTAVRAAFLAVVGSGYAARFARFTERREINARKPAN